MLLWGNMNYNYNEASMGYVNTSNFEGGIYSVRGWVNPYLVTYMESHDEERLMYKNLQFGNSAGSYNIKDLNTALSRIEMCAAFLLNIPGPKMIWEFGELGYDFSINRCSDGSINNNCRLTAKPIHWDYLQNTQRKHLYDIYTSLLKLRAHPWYKDVFIANNINLTRNLSSGFKWLTIRSALDTSILCTIGNFDVTAQTGTFTFPSAGTWYDYLNGNTITATGSAQSILLQPGEFHVYLNRNLVNAVVTAVTDINATGNNLLVNVYPNPVQSNSVIEVNIPENGKAQVNLLNTLGQKTTIIYSGFLTKGKHQLSFTNDAMNLPSGNYLLQVQSKNKSNTVKLVF
ncbi:MAG TPA: T9SS type A sorting domain-containing protein, partial [Chitinophagaceae bacterium]|nr:T9SS type A sorting domain-containing protein [Chitinophagaceae bacterium]